MKRMRVGDGDGVLVISNLDLGDDTFDSDVGSWNVTRAKRDCAAGKYKTYVFEVAEVLACNAAIEVDPVKVASMVADPAGLAQSPPPIFAAENGRVWLIEGHHRLRALAQLGEPQFLAYVIEAADAAPYKVYYNGARVAPWMRKTESES